MTDTPETPEVEDLMRYDVLVQEALRGVVKKVLQEISRTGLPGEHHFYITFNTNHSGVRLSPRMKEKYPEEMTIVVQHQFWDLEATEMGFSIGLSFDNIPETMRVPYMAIVGFFDPAVQFGLQFDNDLLDDMEETASAPVLEEVQNADNISALPTSPKAKTSDKPEKKTKAKAKKKEPAKGKKKQNSEDKGSSDTDTDTETKSENSADVVSLDSFRRK